jgi:hypothetical protein
MQADMDNELSDPPAPSADDLEREAELLLAGHTVRLPEYSAATSEDELLALSSALERIGFAFYRAQGEAPARAIPRKVVEEATNMQLAAQQQRQGLTDLDFPDTDDVNAPELSSGRLRGIARIWVRSDAPATVRTALESHATWLETYREAWGASPVDAEAEAGFRTTVDRLAVDVDRIATERVPAVKARITESFRESA